MQDPERTAVLEARVIVPLEATQAASRAKRAGKAAATRVQFFAMQTMRT
jgi:alpha-D-ribose 1-methylphosphonate 5-triphosphate synthase subunit PhnG